ncbi:MAG: peptidase T [Caldilineaceae bacterium]|nr:peptidase T [Caldilineaceae bacterium]MCB9123779.1 peptidase T [Caldilineaceae bacterium]
MSNTFCPELEERLVRYTAVETTSDETSATMPSTATQLELQRMLQRELVDIGASDVQLDANGFVYATIPATAGGDIPRVALLAHVDTVAGVGAGPVKPRVHRAYDGSPIVFPDDALLVLMPEISPYLDEKIGDDIITASGGTLLGADDKAGVAIIMTLARHLLAHPEIPHGELRICFTPDEEIGTGIRKIDLQRLNADFAYTLDGAEVGEIVYETFSADKATVTITGVSTHPGRAKGKLVNALYLASRLAQTLPHAKLTPETTDGRQGFLHLYKQEGSAAECKMHFILRDFDEEKLMEHGRLLESVCETVQMTEPRARITCEITPQYRNMHYWLQNDMRPVEYVVDVLNDMGIEPLSPPIRGGTDGSQLTEMGVPTPNLFTGMQNIHSPLEWVSVQDMEKSVEVLVGLVQRWAKK